MIKLLSRMNIKISLDLNPLAWRFRIQLPYIDDKIKIWYFRILMLSLLITFDDGKTAIMWDI